MANEISAGQRFAEEYKEIVSKIHLTSADLVMELAEIDEQLLGLSAVNMDDTGKTSNISRPTENTAIALESMKKFKDLEYAQRLDALKEKRKWYDEVIDRANFRSEEQELFKLRYNGEWRLTYKEIAEKTKWAERSVYRIMEVCYKKIERVLE